jgi:hypothetical protein
VWSHGHSTSGGGRTRLGVLGKSKGVQVSTIKVLRAVVDTTRFLAGRITIRPSPICSQQSRITNIGHIESSSGRQHEFLQGASALALP